MNPTIKRSLGLVLQVATVLFGIAVLTFLLWEPHVEGRNAHATPFEIYFHDPFLAYVYLGSIAVFIAIYRAFGLFGQLRQNQPVTKATVAALRIIQRCALIVIGFVAGGMIFIFMMGDKDDRPAGFAMGLFIAVMSGMIATIAAMLAQRRRNSLQGKA